MFRLPSAPVLAVMPVVWKLPSPVSTSLMVSVPVAVRSLAVRFRSSATAPTASPAITAVSFTAVTLKVMVFGLASRSTPPLVVPPLSCTANWKLALATPLALSAGVNTSLFAVMSATATDWSAVTSTLLSLSAPLLGSWVILTASSVFAGVSLTSLNPKSATVSV